MEKSVNTHNKLRYIFLTNKIFLLQVEVEQKRNVMAHAQKPDLVFKRHGRVHLYRRGCQFSRLPAAEVCASAVVMLDRPCSDTVHDCAGYPFHSPFSPSLLHPCVSVCHHIPFLLYVRMYCTVQVLYLFTAQFSLED